MRSTFTLLLVLSALCTSLTALPTPRPALLPEPSTGSTEETVLYRRAGWGFLKCLFCASGLPKASTTPTLPWQRLQHEVPKNGLDTEAALLHRDTMRLQQKQHLTEVKTLTAQAEALQSRRQNFWGIARQIKAGQLGNDAHLRPPAFPQLTRSSSMGSLHRRGLGGMGLGWSKLRCAFGCFGGGGASHQGYVALPSVRQHEDLRPGMEALMASAQARHAQQKVTWLNYVVQRRQGQVDKAQAGVVKAFAQNGAKLERTQSAPARIESNGHQWLGTRDEAGGEE